MRNATAERAVTIVQDLLDDLKTAGLKQADRFVAAARWLGMKPRRVRMIRNNEADRIRPEEYRSVLDGWNQYLDHKAANMAAQIAAIQARKANR